jgi:hypothetical protein
MHLLGHQCGNHVVVAGGTAWVTQTDAHSDAGITNDIVGTRFLMGCALPRLSQLSHQFITTSARQHTHYPTLDKHTRPLLAHSTHVKFVIFAKSCEKEEAKLPQSVALCLLWAHWLHLAIDKHWNYLWHLYCLFFTCYKSVDFSSTDRVTKINFLFSASQDNCTMKIWDSYNRSSLVSW